MVEDFVADCERNLAQWRLGQVDYPGALSVRMGDSVVYVAAVDITDQPMPAERVITAPEVRTAPIAVQCVLSARVVGDSATSVDPAGAVMRRFTPTGTLNWSWRITGNQPGTHELQLELHPTVTTTSGVTIANGQPLETSTFVTKVEVTASTLQNLGQWWRDEWKIVVLVVGAIGGSILALVKWGSKLGDSVGGLRKSWRSERKQPKRRTGRS